MAAAKHDPRVDELRQQLRSLGYLDAGVDRFVLGGAREARSPSAIAWLAGLRIGAVAAMLIGPAAAIGVSARIPALITGARDAFVVAAYMGSIVGAAVCVAASLAGMMVAWRVRRQRERGSVRPRPAAIAAGAVLTIACLAYLTLWWDASAFGRLPLTWTLAGLAFAAGVSLLIGHLVTVASLAASVAAAGAGGQTHGVPGASRGVMAAAGAMAFCGAVLLFTATDRSRGGESPPPALTVVSGGIRLRLIALDGFDPEIGRRLAGSGRIPYLAAALKLSTPPPAGSAGAARTARATVDIDDTRDPARAWTTIATGQPPSVHAVRGLETRRVAGVQGALAAGDASTVSRTLAAVTDLLRLTRPAIARGDERRVKTMWEVAADGGLRTVVVNWWATWPAPVESGIVLTDRAMLRLEHGGELDAEIAPPRLYELLRARWPAIREAATARAALIQRAGQIGDLLRRSAEIDATQLALAVDGPDAASADLVCIYVSGLDVVQHALLTTGDNTALAPSVMAERLEALEEYYVFLDRLLAEKIGATPSLDAEWLNMHLTAPGRVQTRTSGLFAVSGDAANGPAEDARARETDVMPTVLYALGLPISRELVGRPLVELFSADFARRFPVRSVATYGAPSPQQAPRGRVPLDQEMIDRLRSLGYVR